MIYSPWFRLLALPALVLPVFADQASKRALIEDTLALTKADSLTRNALDQESGVLRQENWVPHRLHGTAPTGRVFLPEMTRLSREFSEKPPKSPPTRPSSLQIHQQQQGSLRRSCHRDSPLGPGRSH